MHLTQNFKESANSSAVRKLLMALAAIVVLSVSGYGTVIYIQLMTSVFPSGPLQIACYMGAASNFLLMLVLLVGKFVWFRPGAHEVASWLVTLTELVVAVLNMMLAFQVANHETLSSFMQAWQYLAPVSPIFSMVGATALLMTSTEMRRRHKALEIEEEKEHSEQAFALAMHRAQMDTKGKYLNFVTTGLTQELNAPERQQEMRGHATLLVTQILTEMSGLHSLAPQLRGPQYPNSQTVGASGPLPSLNASWPVSPDESFIGRVPPTFTDASADEWLAQVNQRLEQERTRRASAGLDLAQPHEDRLDSVDELPYSPEDLERLRRIVDAAQRQGYSLDDVASFLGVAWKQVPGKTYEARLITLAQMAEQRGYSLDRFERLLGLDGGSDGKKK